MALGTVGALLGSLVGGVVIILVGQLGYVASISGVVMAVAALKGYMLLGGRLTKKGVAIASVLMVVVTFLAHSLGLAISVASELGVGVFETWRWLPQLLVLADAVTDYWVELAMLYLFTLLGAVPTVISTMRKARAMEQANAQPQPWDSQSQPQQWDAQAGAVPPQPAPFTTTETVRSGDTQEK